MSGKFTYCYLCGRPLQKVTPVPTCAEHGALWQLTRHAPCADVLIARDHDVLLTLRAHDPYAGMWEMPGGHQEFGEHPADAARREVKEELGIAVNLHALLGVFIEKMPNKDVHQTTVYIGSIEEVPSLADGEVERWQWFNELHLPRNLMPSHRPRLEYYFSRRDAGKF